MTSHDNNQVNSVLEIGYQMSIYCMLLKTRYQNLKEEKKTPNKQINNNCSLKDWGQEIETTLQNGFYFRR